MRTAVYAGSFDPVTNGHLDIIGRAAGLFDRLIVAVAENSGKESLFGEQERLEMLRAVCGQLSSVVVERLPGLLVDFARARGAMAIVRGLRAVSDFEVELQMASMNQALAPEVETVFLMTSPEHHYLSSSIVKEITRFGGDVSRFVPPVVERELRRKLAGKQGPHAPGSRAERA